MNAPSVGPSGIACNSGGAGVLLIGEALRGALAAFRRTRHRNRGGAA